MSSDTYKVASLLYTAVSDDAGQTANATIRKNMEILSSFASQASAQGAQLMVFPESTTGTLQWPNFSSEKAAEYAEGYPIPGVTVCNNDTYDTPAFYQHYTSACMAKNTSMYIAMNIIESMDCRKERQRELKLQSSSPEEVTCADLTESKHYLFNSLAIYDPSGTLVAKYRKSSTFPLYYDTAFPEQHKEKADFTTFETSFGVEFGVLICADATNPHLIPAYAQAGIKNILLPLYDGGRPPVSSITAIHAGHSYNYGLNVIASQSQTFSGVGLYQSGTPLFWNINPNPFSGTPYNELIVRDVVKDPEAPPPLATTKDLAIDASTPETCRWLGNEDTEVDCPCLKIEVTPGSTVDFRGKLNQTVQLPDSEQQVMECSIEASLAPTENTTETYAMMVGWRNSSQLDYILFCEIVICHSFPDCSKDCPLCTAPYMGSGTLTRFDLQASVPDYFENGDRQMRVPIMNSFAGMPASGEKYSWIAQEGTRYMSLGENESVNNLMGAGLFYIGFAPLASESTPTPSQQPVATSSGYRFVEEITGLWVTIVCVFVAILRR